MAYALIDEVCRRMREDRGLWDEAHNRIERAYLRSLRFTDREIDAFHQRIVGIEQRFYVVTAHRRWKLPGKRTEYTGPG
jgi:nicotinic acid phosphoribosyltransferase